jgi:hypothetical protein
MRNRIPEVAEAVVIEDFYRGSNDSAFVRAILQKAPTTSEQLFQEADLYITADEQALDLIRGAKPAPTAPRRDTNQQPDKRWEKRPREEVHAAGPPASRARGGPRGGERTLDDILNAQCSYHKDMRHTLRNCRDFKHSVDQWLNFDHPGKYSLLVDPVIQESRVKKVLVDGGSIINVTFPRTLQGLRVPLKELQESDTPFFGIVPTEGEYPLGHIYMSVTVGTLENYRTEFMRFEVANFDCGYNAIIGRPGLAKFMAIPHYTYMILKMPGPQGIITVRADFQGAAECFRVAI